MNGEVKSYNLGKPMSWKEFKAMPLDLQRDYLTKLADEVGAGRQDVADMFGVRADNLSEYLNRKHRGAKYFANKKPNQESFLRWYCGEESGDAETPEKPEIVEAVAEKNEEFVPPVNDVIRIVDAVKEEKVTSSAIERGKLEFCGSAEEVFNRMMMILGDSEKYRILIVFDKVDEIERAVARDKK